MVKRRKSYRSVKIEIKEENKTLQGFNNFLLEKLKYYKLLNLFWAFLIVISIFIIYGILLIFSNSNLNFPISFDLYTFGQHEVSSFLILFFIYILIAIFPLREFIFYNLYPLFISKELEKISKMKINNFKDKVKVIEKLETVDEFELTSRNEAKNQILDFTFNVLRILKEAIIHIVEPETFDRIKNNINSLSKSFKDYEYRTMTVDSHILWGNMKRDRFFENYETYKDYGTKGKKLNQNLRYTILIAILTWLIKYILDLMISIPI